MQCRLGVMHVASSNRSTERLIGNFWFVAPGAGGAGGRRTHDASPFAVLGEEDDDDDKGGSVGRLVR